MVLFVDIEHLVYEAFVIHSLCKLESEKFFLLDTLVVTLGSKEMRRTMLLLLLGSVEMQ
jgi:hypothetical protein